jgi:dolichol-phosphate mannosyltransferase
MKFLVIAVNYNNTIEIRDFLRKLKSTHPVLDTIVIDDGSTDDSQYIIKEEGFKSINHEQNQGIGAAIRTGINYFFQEALDCTAVAIMSCNGKMDPADLKDLTKPILEGQADYVQGNRYLDSSAIDLPLFRRIAAPLFSIFGSLFLSRNFNDLSCGFRVYTKEFLSHPDIDINQSWLNRYELEYYLHYKACTLGFRIVEVPVRITYSHLHFTRRSKIKPLIGWWSMIRPFILLSTGLKR